MDTTALMNFEDLNGCSTLSIASTDYSASIRCSPLIVLPTQVTTLNPAFAYCTPQLGGLVDPPYALTAAPGLAPFSSTIVTASPSTTHSVPTPPSTQSPWPTVTHTQPPTRNSQPPTTSSLPPPEQHTTSVAQPATTSTLPPPEQHTTSVAVESPPASESSTTAETPALPVLPQSSLATDSAAKSQSVPTTVPVRATSSEPAIIPSAPNGFPVSEDPTTMDRSSTTVGHLSVHGGGSVQVSTSSIVHPAPSSRGSIFGTTSTVSKDTTTGDQAGSTTAVGLALSVHSSGSVQANTSSIVPSAPISGSSSLGTPSPSLSIGNDGLRNVHVRSYTGIIILAAILFVELLL